MSIIVALTLLAQLGTPIQKVGPSCPLGYYAQGAYCTPSSGVGRYTEAFPRAGNSCPGAGIGPAITALEPPGSFGSHGPSNDLRGKGRSMAAPATLATQRAGAVAARPRPRADVRPAST